MRRDVGGLLLLILMPAILIIVMALVQDAPFKDYHEMKFDLLLADNDRGSLAAEIKTGLRESENFNVIDSFEGQPLTEAKLQELLANGQYHVGIVIPKGATAEVVNSANTIANKLSEKLGMGKLPAREAREGKHIRMYFDPVSKPTFRTSISFALDKYITYSCSNLLVKRLSKMAGDTTENAAEQAEFKQVFAGIGIQEEVLNTKGTYSQYINSVQHNVPAWAIFGMFFIVVPIAGHMIREREEGSALRIQLIPNALISVALGKILCYTLVCSIQFAIMVAIGVWVMPMLGLPALYLGLHGWVLIPMAISIAFAATAYGYFIGAVFKTTNQAMPFGAISIVILSALGGIWVPIDLLPPNMQKIAMLSPLHWGLDGIHHIILRNNGIKEVLPHLGVLIGFGSLMWGISVFKNRNRGHSVQ